MKQVRFEAFGDPADVLRCVEIDDPGPPGADEVAVRIEAFPVNPADLLTAAGEYGALPELPATLGSEAVGLVEAAGTAVSGIVAGDRVMILDVGNWSQLRNVPAAGVVKVPADADPLQLAMLKVNPATAWLLLERYADLAPSDAVIQNIANSGVGRAVAMIGRSRGLRVVNVVRRADAADGLRALGEELVVVDGPMLAREVAEATEGLPIRLALDAVAGAATARLADCLAAGGTVVTYGRMSMEPCRIRPDQLVFKDIAVRGFWLSRYLQDGDPAAVAAMYDRLAAMMAAGDLAVPIEAVYPIEEIGGAVAHAARANRGGKILVAPNGPVTA